MIRDYSEGDLQAVTDICNFYIATSTATFETEALAPDQMAARLEAMLQAGLPVLVAQGGDGSIEGYAYVHPWKERACYWPTLELTCYLRHGCTGRGLGRKLCEAVLKRVRALGRHRVVIACITANNAASIALVRSMGFTQASLFKGVGEKFGRRLDVVDWSLEL